MEKLIRNAEIRDLRLRGVKPREVAQRLKLTPSVVAGVLHRAGMTVEPRGRGFAIPEEKRSAMRADRIAGMTFSAIADHHQVCTMTVHRYVRDVAT